MQPLVVANLSSLTIIVFLLRQSVVYYQVYFVCMTPIFSMNMTD